MIEERYRVTLECAPILYIGMPSQAMAALLILPYIMYIVL